MGKLTKLRERLARWISPELSDEADGVKYLATGTCSDRDFILAVEAARWIEFASTSAALEPQP